MIMIMITTMARIFVVTLIKYRACGRWLSSSSLSRSLAPRSIARGPRAACGGAWTIVWRMVALLEFRRPTAAAHVMNCLTLIRMGMNAVAAPLPSTPNARRPRAAAILIIGAPVACLELRPPTAAARVRNGLTKIIAGVAT